MKGKLIQKISISALTICTVAAVAGAITGTVAWFQLIKVSVSKTIWRQLNLTPQNYVFFSIHWS